MLQKCVGGLDPTAEAYSAPSNPLAGYEGKERNESRGKRVGREGMVNEGKRDVPDFIFPNPAGVGFGRIFEVKSGQSRILEFSAM